MFDLDTTPAAVEQLRPGLSVVRLPIPFRTDPVCCYVLEEADGSLTVLDAGIALTAEASWRAALAELGASLDDVGRIVVTHFHPDHIGGTGPLARLTGAPVVAGELTARQAPLVWAPEHREPAFERINQQLLEHGFPAAHLEELRHEVEAAGFGVELPERFGRLPADGEPVVLGGEEWTVLATPGHADGHVAFFQPERSELLAGDHLLERISPAVGRFPDHSLDPLGHYMESLARTAALAPATVYPGHGAPFADGAARCAALRRHHEQRVDACLAALADGPVPAWSVAQAVFGTGHDVANQRFALTETLAHLEYARARGRALLEREPGAPARYSVAPTPGVG